MLNLIVLFEIIVSQDPEVARRRPKGQNCLMGCCSSNLEEPNGCHSQVSTLYEPEEEACLNK